MHLRKHRKKIKKLSSKVDDEDFMKEIYAMMDSDAATLPQAIGKFVDNHANAFAAAMVKRYKNKTYDELQASLRDRRLPSTVNKVEAIK